MESFPPELLTQTYHRPGVTDNDRAKAMLRGMRERITYQLRMEGLPYTVTYNDAPAKIALKTLEEELCAIGFNAVFVETVGLKIDKNWSQ